MFDTIMRRLENTLIAVTFLFITLLTFTNVVSRYVFHASFSFTVELVINIAVLLTMVGAAAATRLGAHPSFSLLRDASRGLLRKIVIVVICLGMLTFFLVFLWLGFDMAMKQAASGRMTPALQLPQWLFSMGLPFGALLGAIRTVQVAVIEFRGGEAFKGEEVEALEAAGVTVDPELVDEARVPPDDEDPGAREREKNNGDEKEGAR